MEDFVNFELAKKLKEKGFDEACYNYYEPLKHCLSKLKTQFTNKEGEYYGIITAPTISQVLKWLRKEKKLYVGVTYSPKIEGSQDFFYATIQYIGDYKKTIYPDDNYDNWEEAALNGINYVLDNLI